MLRFNMLRKEDNIRLQHMLDSATEAVGYTVKREQKELETDRQLTHSLVRCVEIIGEAANKVSIECQEAYPQIPWKNVIGMRNKLIHAYFDINLTILWRTVRQELPLLISELKSILESDKI